MLMVYLTGVRSLKYSFFKPYILLSLGLYSRCLIYVLCSWQYTIENAAGFSAIQQIFQLPSSGLPMGNLKESK
jgi:hypothetical protein